MIFANDTIFAPSTAIGGAISVIRISGPGTAGVMRALTHKKLQPRVLTYLQIKHDSETIDNGMAVWFPAPNSYTGEDMLELHCHGGLQVFRRVSDLLLSLHLRPAEGGEFTRRAFLNGKMDLSQAEAVMDVINAHADSSLRSALYQLNGGIGATILDLENRILDILSRIEAAIDYPDEMEDITRESLFDDIRSVSDIASKLYQRSQGGRYLRDGIRAVIVGRPNVGKSSLFNALLEEERAIVTSIPGTTRDLLDERTEWDGVSVRLMDTAGLREAADEAESIGVERARDAFRFADLILLVIDISAPLQDEDYRILSSLPSVPVLTVLNKADCHKCSDTEQFIMNHGKEYVLTSCRTLEGIDALKRKCVQMLSVEHVDTTCLTNIRHIKALHDAIRELEQSCRQSELDCIATDLHEAVYSLGTITGTAVDDKLLDKIFENFCVGK